MKARIILATVGSLGDLHPFIGLGRALRACGVDVILASAAEYRGKVESAGLEFRPLRPSFDDLQRDLGMTRVELTKSILSRGEFLFDKIVAPYVRAAYDDMDEMMCDADLVLTSSLAIGARLAAERRAVPWIAVVLQPALFLSAFDPPVIPGAEWVSALLRRLGPVPTRWVLRLVSFAIGRLLRPVQTLRRDIGLPVTHLNPILNGQFSAAGAIGLYSKLLGDVRPDFPAKTVIVGFAWHDSEDGTEPGLDVDLERFLDGGSRPLVFTLGSLIVNSPGMFYRNSVAAADALGKRAVLLVGADAVAEYSTLRSHSVHVCGYAPHSQIFPRAEVIVHQCGVGTLAQALRSGRPQLTVPFYGDQADNAARTVTLGVARRIAPTRYNALSAERELARLIGMASYRARAAQVRELLAHEDGAATAARLVMRQLNRPT